MNDRNLELYLLASRPQSTAYNPFTQSVISAIRQNASRPTDDTLTTWQRVREFVAYSTLRKAVLLALIVFVTAFVGLSGYAYANNTDPFTLIKRWISGEQVTITYRDPQTGEQRTFNHGVKRNYSDVAVSAFAEVNLVDLLHFHATNAYTTPKDGIEHIEDPFRTDYIYPRVGTITEVNEKSVVLHLTYSVGLSKVEPSRDIDEHITIPRQHFYYYEQGKLAAAHQDSVGKHVEVYQDQYLQHKQHAGELPVPVDLYSAFALSHSMEAIKEATATKGSIKADNDAELQAEISEQDIQELGLGAWAKVCLANGADACPHAFRDDDGDNLYAMSTTSKHYGGQSRQNPDMMPFGEAVANPTAGTRQYQLRHIEGRIDKISGDRITIKTSSGAHWTFQYSTENQKNFAKAYGYSLKPGQLLAGGVIASVYGWDRRDFDSQYVFGMSSYK